MKIPTHFSFHTIYLTALGDAAAASHLHHRMKPIFTTALRRALAPLTRLMTLTILLLAMALPGYAVDDSESIDLNRPTAVPAYDFKINDIYYKIISSAEKTVKVTYLDSDYNSSKVTIPAQVSYNNIVYSVTVIGYHAFYMRNMLTDVSIPSTVTSIEEGAFCECTSLSITTVPSSVKEIGRSAFSRCSSLTSFYIPESIELIGNDAFAYCTSLRNIAFSESDHKLTLGRYVFTKCTSLNDVVIPSSVFSIDGCFQYCTALTNISIPNSVSSISGAFFECTSLKSIRIPDSVNSIGIITFAGCTSLSEISLPNSVTDLGLEAFIRCTSLTTIVLPSSVSYISKYTFSECTSLVGINLPSSLKGIGVGAFQNCTSLTDIIIPNSVTKIESGAFDGCTSLSHVEIPNSVTSIGGKSGATMGAFNNCKALRSIDIPSSVKFQGDGAFDGSGVVEAMVYGPVTATTAKAKITRSSIYVDGKLASLIELIGGKFVPISVGKEFSIDCYPQSNPIVRIMYNHSTGAPMILTTFRGAITSPPLINSFEASVTSPVSISASVDLNLIDGIDAEAENPSFIINDKSCDGAARNIEWKDLIPESTYKVYFATRLNWFTLETNIWNSKTVTLETLALTLGAGEATATSYTSARLRCETNLPDGVSGGFEWMRENAPSSMKPSKAPCPVVNGALTGSLRNLKDEVYYKCRPYYIASNGTEYYGEWFIVFTGDAGVYFEPEVQTYVPKMTETADGFSVSLSGYALAGSDDITAQGFEYRAIGKSRAAAGWNSVKASGVLMNVTLEDLDAGTEYECRAFVQTSQGAFYGASQTFTTPSDAGAIDDVMASPAEEATVVGYYNLQGIRLSAPTRGVNIVVYSDGTRRKVMM